MYTSFTAFLLALALFALPNPTTQTTQQVPLIPDTAVAEEVTITEATEQVNAALKTAPSLPTRLVIPAINLNSPVQHLGLNNKGEMDVPSGKTNNVGWYKHGTLPGQTGSAVMDAHVFAAFKNLKNLKVGEHIYVVNAQGETLDFVVRDSRVYPLSQVPAELLFNRADSQRLNLITCAGTFIQSAGTYDHRLVVYAELVK
jgi:sortase A